MRSSRLSVRLATALVLSGLAFATTAAAQNFAFPLQAQGFLETINGFSYSGNRINRVERGFGDDIDSSGLAYKCLLVTEASPTGTACTLADGTAGLREDLVRADLFRLVPYQARRKAHADARQQPSHDRLCLHER